MFTPLLGVLLLAALWSAYWFIAVAYAKQTMAAQRQSFEQQGLTLTCAEESWDGYPFRFEFTCTEPVITKVGAGRISGSRVLAMALAYNPKQIVFLIDGPDTALRTATHDIAVLHGRATASITFDKDWKPRLAAEIPEIEVPKLLTAKKAMVFTRPKNNEEVEIALNVDALRWQRPKRPELLIDAGQLTGSLTNVPVLSADKIELTRGPVRYWGSGRLELDALHRPSGKLATQTNDLNGLLDIIDPHLLITDQEKANLRLVLGLLGQQAKADLIFSEGQFFIGPYKISDIVPLY